MSEPGGERREPFSEKSFYLSEFRGRTLAIAAAAPGIATRALEPVLKELEANQTRAVLLSTRADALAALLDARLLDADAPRLEGAVWRELRRMPRVGVVVADAGRFATACREIALRLGVTKLLWLDGEGALLRSDGRRHSFVDLAELGALLRSGPSDGPRAGLLREIEAALRAGLPAINLCTPEGLAQELFTYAGSGTLFTRERYVAVRRLGIDDFDAADDLIARGVAEGYLAPRTPAQVEEVLAGGFGAFVEGRHLAGIGALLLYDGASAAEIVSLYTLTRFSGEGIGAHLVTFALERAAAAGCDSVFACTAADRAVEFFERLGFERVALRELPEQKWQAYDAERRGRVTCLRRALDRRARRGV